MLRVAACDDEQVFLDMVSECCSRYFEDRGLEYQLWEYSDGRELLGEVYDIVLLDVEMPAISGIDVKNYIEKQRNATRIIFISSYPEAMPDAFGDNVSGFLVKPLSYEKFEKKMDEVLKKIDREERYVMCDAVNKETVKIYIKDILYIEADGHYSRIYRADGGALFVLKSMGEFGEEFAEDLVSCHKSYVVNMAYIRTIKKNVILKNGAEIPLGRTVRDKVKEKHNMYILRRT